MKSWFEIKVRGVLGPDLNDDKEVVILGRTVRLKSWGIEWEADPKHGKLLMERFGYGVNTKALNCNGDNTTHNDDEEKEVLLSGSDGVSGLRCNVKLFKPGLS